jgi:serine/threonine-protein kinase RsbW
MISGASSPNSLEHRLEIGTATPELRRLSAWLHDLLQDALPRDALFALDLGLHEAVANAMAYAFPDRGAHTIAVTMRLLKDRVEIEVEDDGIPFDPLAVTPSPLPTRLEDVMPGGNGIRLMRRFLDGLSYSRASGHNHLLMTRRVKAGGGT